MVMNKTSRLELSIQAVSPVSNVWATTLRGTVSTRPVATKEIAVPRMKLAII